MKRRAMLLSLVLAAALCGCAPAAVADVETLLRAPQLSGQGSAITKALNSYLGSSATLKYPTGETFSSPFLLGDWDGDGEQEAAALYTAEGSGVNIRLAVLEPDGDGWKVSQTVEGLSGEIESITTAHLRDTDSLQIIAGYGSAQGDRYLVVYRYFEGTLQTVIMQSYTHMILADLTGSGDGTEDLVLALPTETENGGITLQLLTAVEGEFRSRQTLAVGQGSYNGCAGLHAGQDSDGRAYLVVDGWASTGANSLASVILLYDDESGYLNTYNPPGLNDPFRATLRYDTSLLSRDIDGNETVDIPVQITDGGTVQEPMDKRLQFLLWQDYATPYGGHSRFGVYDTEYRYFVPLPESMHGNVLLRANGRGTGWQVCSAEGDTTYCEVRLVDPGSEEEESVPFRRIANIGDQQLQVRILTPRYGLDLDDLAQNTVLLG